MRTVLRSKVTLLFIVCAALLAFGGTAMALVSDPSGDTSATTSSSPTITSDKADYAPGELVTLTGGNWAPGESVNVVVNDDLGQTWNRNVNVTADASGNISDSFNLPDWFVATYSVKATGASGAVATSSFTDAVPTTTTVTSSKNPSALNESVTFTAKVKYSTTTTGTGGHTAGDAVANDGKVVFGTGGNATCGGSFNQLSPTAVEPDKVPDSNGEVTYTTSTLPAGDTTIKACFTNPGAGSTGAGASQGSVIQTVNAVTATSVSNITASASTFGGTTDLSAKVSPLNAPGSVEFFVNGSSAGTGTYNQSTGVATLSNYSHGLNASTTPYSVKAVFTPSGSSFSGSDATNASALTVAKANQTITFNALSNKTYGDANFTLSATGGASGNPVTFALDTNSKGCSLSGTNNATVTITGATAVGEKCIIVASQAGNANYNAATDVTRDFTIAKANQTINITTQAPTSKAYDESFTVAATATSGLPVAYSSAGSCSNNGATFTMTSGTGTCTVKYNQAGNSNYNAATEVTESVTATKANQTITFGTLSNKTYGDANFTLSATGGASGNPVTFALDPDSKGCSLSGTNNATVTITGATAVGEKCIIVASQAGNANYNAATDVTRDFTIAKANQTITGFSAITNKIVGATFPVSATATSGLDVSFSASGSCTLSGNDVSVTGVGPCTITASQGGNSNYNAAPNVQQIFNATFNFTGFSSPVDNLDQYGNPVLNSAKAGQAIPLKWRLTDASGNPVTNLLLTDVKVSVVNYTCGLSTTADLIEEYTGSSGLQNLGNGYYQYNWKTPTNYANSCKTMTLDLGEGTLTKPHTAVFKFTK